jgi:hypothetical protein
MSDLSQHDDTRQNELIMKEDNDIMMNVDELRHVLTVRFADFKEKQTTESQHHQHQRQRMSD